MRDIVSNQFKMLSNTAKLTLGILATQFSPANAWWGFGGASAEPEKVVVETIEEPTTAELIEEEPALDKELLQAAD